MLNPGERGLDEATTATHTQETKVEKADTVNVPATSFSEENLVTIVGFQSLLMQFSHPQVRADFMNGCFGLNINPGLLSKLDDFRWTLFPRWQSGGLAAATERNKLAVMHLQKLMKKSPELMPIGDSVVGSLTYEEWFATLEAIASNRHWESVPSTKRCVHILPSDAEDSSVQSSTSHAQSSANLKPVLNAKIKYSDTKPVKSKVSIKKSRKPVKVEEITISSSDSSAGDSEEDQSPESDFSEDGNSSSGSSDGQSRGRRRRRRLRSSKTHVDAREAVTPPVFEMNGRVSLKTYLMTFECYFMKKYKGTAYDQTQTLSKFLTGDLLKVFEAKGGRKLKYSSMKRELLEYYKKKKVGGKSYWKNELKIAKPLLDEGCDLYGMRLTELAQLAYPGNKKECARHLRKKFLSSVPSDVSSKIKDAESTLRVASGGNKKYLTFTQILELAVDLQKDQCNRAIMLAQQPQYNRVEFRSPEAQIPPRYPEFTPQRQRSISRGRQDGEYMNRSGSCSYCNRPNHSRDECWRAARLCLICGKRHSMENCPKFNPNYKSNSRPLSPRRSLND